MYLYHESTFANIIIINTDYILKVEFCSYSDCVQT